MKAVIAGDPSSLDVLKVEAGKAADDKCACGDHWYEASIDLGLGAQLGLAVEQVPGLFCVACGAVHFPDQGADLRARMSAWLESGDEPERVEPSLRYETDSHPRSVQIEVTTRCNLACSYCSHRLLDSPTDVAWPAFLDTISRIDFSAVHSVDFTGLGEAALNPALPRMIAEVATRAPTASLRIVSNAVSASVDRWISLIGAGLSSVAFSIDTLDPHRFARQRGGAAVAKAIRTVEGVAAHRRSGAGRPFALRVKAVLLDDPYADAEALLSWSRSIGLDMPQFSSLDRRQLAQPLYEAAPWLADAFDGDDEAERLDRWATARWRELGGPIRPPEDARRHQYRNPRLAPEMRVCRWALDATYIAEGGDILSCCESMIDMPRATVGALSGRSLAEAWQDDLLWNYRLPLSLGLLPGGCVGCAYAPAPIGPER